MKNLQLAAASACLALQPALALTAHAEGWQTTLTPYLWTVGIDGDVKHGPIDVNVSADFDDIVDNMDAGGGLMLEAGNGRWVNFLQADFLKIDTGDVDTRIPGADAELEQDSLLATAATGYRVQFAERSHLDVLVGLRYAGIETDVSVQGLGERNSDNNQYDGILMLRPQFEIARNWYFSPTASIGAGDSDLTWELAPHIVYDACNYNVRIGYRTLAYEIENGDSELDIEFGGLLLGVGFTF
jgi:hypothetical protein